MSVQAVAAPRKDWKWVTLADVAKVVTGNTPPTADAQNYGDAIPFVKPTELVDRGIRFAPAGLADQALGKARVVPAGAVLVSCIGNLGKTGIAKVPVAFNQQINAVVFNENVIPEFGFYYAQTLKSWLYGESSATTLPIINKGKFQQAPFPLAPIAEQREIVAELEKQFSRLDEAVANLKRIKANLKRYKASVLKDAVEGRLVPTGVAARSDSEENMDWVPISKAIKSLDQGWSPQCESESRTSNDEWAVMKTTAIQSMDFWPDENKRLPPGLVARASLEVMAGDLLITRAGPRSRVGVTCLVKSDRPRLMLCDKAYRLRAKLDIAIPAYLEVVLNSPTLLQCLDELKSGISDSGLNLTQKRFGELLVPLPSLAEQQRIVDEVDRRLSLVRGVEAEVDANLKRGQALRQSVLASAFSS